MSASTVMTISDEELDSVAGGECLVYLNGECLVPNVAKLPFVMSLIA